MSVKTQIPETATSVSNPITISTPMLKASLWLALRY